MACGDKYRHLIKTTAGRTPDDPCIVHENICIPGEYDPWYVPAANIAREVKYRWEVLLAAEKVDETDEYSRELGKRVAAYEAAFKDLPTSTWGDIFSSDTVLISNSVSNMNEGACVMELLDEAIVEAGGKPPEAAGVGEAKATMFEKFMGGLIVVSVVGVGATLIYHGVKYKRQREVLRAGTQ